VSAEASCVGAQGGVAFVDRVHDAVGAGGEGEGEEEEEDRWKEGCAHDLGNPLYFL